MKVLVTGLGIGYDFGICDTCNMNLSWVINNPSIFLWADKIVIPEDAFRIQLEDNDNKFNKAVNLVLDIANDSKIIEAVNIRDTYTKVVGKEIERKSEIDIKNILENFPEITKQMNQGVPGEFELNGMHYCGPYISSLNASLFLGQELNANCLFSEPDYNFLKYKYGIRNNELVYQFRAFDDVFSCHLPNEMLIHNYAFVDEKTCENCNKRIACEKTYLKDIEERTKQIILLRERDELYIAREELQKVIDKTEYINSIQYINEIKKEYEEKQMRINKNLKLIFPKVKRWTNITASISTAISVGNLMSGNMEVAAIAGGISGLSKIVDEGMKYYESKNSWVSFINKGL